MCSVAEPDFEYFCRGLASVFNSAETTEDICQVVGLNADDFPEPLHGGPAVSLTKELACVHFGDLKSEERALEKVQEMLAQGWLADDEAHPSPKGRYVLTDMLRATIAFEDPFVMALCLAAMKKILGPNLVRVSNRYCFPDANPPRKSHTTCIVVNIRIHGVVCEINLMFRCFEQLFSAMGKYWDIQQAKDHTDLNQNHFIKVKDMKLDDAGALLKNANASMSAPIDGAELAP